MKKGNNDSNDNNCDFIISNSLYNVGPYPRFKNSLIGRKTHTRYNVILAHLISKQ